MDLMLDKKMKVWMCEVNTDPGLGYPDKEVPWLRFLQVVLLLTAGWMTGFGGQPWSAW